MDSNNDIRQMILKNCSSDQLAEVARRAGMRTLAEDGWRLVRLGVTTAEEVLRVTKDQSLSSGGGGSAEPGLAGGRSEEGRGGEGGRSRGSPEQLKKKKTRSTW